MKLRELSVNALSPPPKATNEHVSKSMKANKATNTKPERILKKALWDIGAKGYRLNWCKASGRPDICYPAKKLAIFVHGCFWHRCPKCNLSLPKTNQEFWQTKFERNVERDKLKSLRLEEAGWTVLTFWECDIKKDVGKIVEEVKSYLSESCR